MNALDRMQPKARSSNWMTKLWRINLIIIVVLGLCFRFTNLDLKTYWFDETYTSLRVSGFTQQEVIQNLYTGSVISVNDLLKYQQFSSQKNYWGTIQGLAKEEPQHVPLYFILARCWSHLFGSSIAVQRGFAVLTSLPILFLTYWLCRLLFKASLIAEMGLALIAISPFFVLYAQENRPYSLWATIILISTISLLKAIKLSKKYWWICYTISLILGLYSFLFTGLIIFSHGIYIAITEKLSFTKVTLNFLLSCLISFLALVPWIIIVVNNLDRIQKTVANSEVIRNFSLIAIIKSFIGRIGYVFIDLNPNHTYLESTNLLSKILNALQYIGGFAIVLLVVYACYFTFSKAPKKSFILLFCLILGNLLPLLMLDLIIGGEKVRLITNRYIIPTFLVLEIFMAYLLAQISLIQSPNEQRSKILKLNNQLGKIITILVITVGIISCLISSQATMWWHKGANYYVPPMAQIINQTEKPLIITDDRTQKKPLRNVIGDIVSLAHALENKANLQLLIYPQLPQIPNTFSNIFLFKPSSNLRQGLLAQQYNLELVYGSENTPALWKVKVDSNN